MANDTTICLDVAASCRDGVVGTSHDAPTRVAHFDDVAPARNGWYPDAGGRDVGDVIMPNTVAARDPAAKIRALWRALPRESWASTAEIAASAKVAYNSAHRYLTAMVRLGHADSRPSSQHRYQRISKGRCPAEAIATEARGRPRKPHASCITPIAALRLAIARWEQGQTIVASAERAGIPTASAYRFFAGTLSRHHFDAVRDMHQSGRLREFAVGEDMTTVAQRSLYSRQEETY